METNELLTSLELEADSLQEFLKQVEDALGPGANWDYSVELMSDEEQRTYLSLRGEQWRWMQLGKTKLQEGLMCLRKAITSPEEF